MTTELLPIAIRDAEPTDEGFIISTWLKSFRKGSDFARNIYRDLFFTFHHGIVETILARPNTAKLVACQPDAPEVIYGYMVFARMDPEVFYRLKLEFRPIVHYLYVKEAFRQMRVASRLIEKSAIDPSRIYLTHHTRDKADMNEFTWSVEEHRRVPNPWYMKPRWRGAETLLQKWPLAHDEMEEDAKTRRRSFTFHDGNLYAPYLV